MFEALRALGNFTPAMGNFTPAIGNLPRRPADEPKDPHTSRVWGLGLKWLYCVSVLERRGRGLCFRGSGLGFQVQGFGVWVHKLFRFYGVGVYAYGTGFTAWRQVWCL